MKAPDPRQNPNYAKRIQQLEALNPDQLAYMGPIIATLQGIPEDVRERLTIARLGAAKQSGEKRLAQSKELTAQDLALAEKGQKQRYELAANRLAFNKEQAAANLKSSEGMSTNAMEYGYENAMKNLDYTKGANKVSNIFAGIGVPIAAATAYNISKDKKAEAQWKKDLANKMFQQRPYEYNYAAPPA